jgi:hypothetical protein
MVAVKIAVVREIDGRRFHIANHSTQRVRQNVVRNRIKLCGGKVQKEHGCSTEGRVGQFELCPDSFIFPGLD